MAMSSWGATVVAVHSEYFAILQALFPILVVIPALLCYFTRYGAIHLQ